MEFVLKAISLPYNMIENNSGLVLASHISGDKPLLKPLMTDCYMH